MPRGCAYHWRLVKQKDQGLWYQEDAESPCHWPGSVTTEGNTQEVYDIGHERVYSRTFAGSTNQSRSGRQWAWLGDAQPSWESASAPPPPPPCARSARHVRRGKCAGLSPLYAPPGNSFLVSLGRSGSQSGFPHTPFPRLLSRMLLFSECWVWSLCKKSHTVPGRAGHSAGSLGPTPDPGNRVGPGGGGAANPPAAQCRLGVPLYAKV